MSISLYFGLPGCGKTTYMCHLIFNALKSQRYKNVYCNVPNSIPGVTVIDNSCISLYDLSYSFICIDEASIYADSRDFKNFNKQKVSFFLLHRHYHCDIALFTQQWDGVDRKIRVITDRVFYLYRGPFSGLFFTRGYRVPYGIIIPDPRHDHSQLGEIIQGYRKPTLFVRLFGIWCFRPFYYKYFDSWIAPPLDPLPERYVVNNGNIPQPFFKKVSCLFRRFLFSFKSFYSRFLRKPNHTTSS